MATLSYLSNAEIGFIEGLYADYAANPDSVGPEWRRFFEGFTFGAEYSGRVKTNGSSVDSADLEHLKKEIRVINLINGYRSRGHLFARTNPVRPNKSYEPTLDHKNFDLTDEDLNEVFQAGQEIGIGPAPLAQIIEHLKATYCGTIGVEFKYIRRPSVVKWFETRMESVRNTPNFSAEEKKQILRLVGRATFFEEFLQRKFTGQKRFSLEGAEALIPALEGIIEEGAERGIREFVIGMAHRGRLNVLTNILRKEYDAVFGEFTGKGLADDVFDGDVKYHMGFSSDPVLDNGKTVHLSLAPNPSHLEAVDPVVAGMARCKMDHLYDGDNGRICPILIHGDASLAGQGIVYELIQMSKLPGYAVGGTVHIVINNQVGFTTNPEDSRSSTYCTDVAKVTLSPVFHVNGDDPEALVYVTRLAMAYRQEFKQDVFIDLICYRKYGHNEGDEPRYTQPLLYNTIAGHPSPYKVYVQKLLAEKALTEAEVKQVEKEIADHLNEEFEQSKTEDYKIDAKTRRSWEGLTFYDDKTLEPNPVTGVELDLLKTVARQITVVPPNFNLHKNLERIFAQRRDMVEKTDKIDWAMGELLAYGSLLATGTDVRITGQDVRRGTFSHRHAVVIDQKTEETYCPLNNIGEGQGRLHIYNSLLSEYAVMGFELGYAMANPKVLTIWEAQYGDFFNGAQIIVDQFLSSSKTKWQRLCGLVLLLPHGYEGGGPEHSSARIERFLILCAENNMYVVNCTTPANFFHALRRQILSNTRRPLVVFSPKSLLRLPACVSSLKDFGPGTVFQEVFDDETAESNKVKRVIFTSGKLYYELLDAKVKFGLEETAIVRLEQYYPFPQDRVDELFKRYEKAEWIWAQEEPGNMGAWPYLVRRLRRTKIECVARKESASPATGSAYQHQRQQDYIIKKALNLDPSVDLRK
jgi:2-oxoglutarate dehydrogenase E1 component